jgi:hypothetical protein
MSNRVGLLLIQSSGSEWKGIPLVKTEENAAVSQPRVLNRQAGQVIQDRWPLYLALAATIFTFACSFGGQQQGKGLGAANHLISLTADVTVNNQPDSPNLTFTLGTNATLNFTVSNSGNEASDQTVTLTVTLPAGISFVSYVSVNGNWTCNAAGQIITCTSSASVLGLANSVPIINMTVSVANNAQGPTQMSVSLSTPDGANGGTSSSAKGVNFAAAPGSNNLCKPQGSESALKGAWVFLEDGSPSAGGGHLGIGGTFVTDGNGGITSGSWDVAIPFQVPMVSYTADSSSANSGSSYSLDSSGRGCLAFVSTNPANNNTTTQIFHIAMAEYSNGSPTSGYVMDFTPGPAAGSGNGTFATGIILPGAGNPSNSTLSGNFVFGVGGEASGTPASAAGNITFDGNGGINSAANGLGDSDIGGTLASAQAIAAGTYNLATGGRGTIKFTVGNVSIAGVIYVSEGAGSVLILSGGSTAYSVLTGRAIPFSGLGATPNTAIAGYQLVTVNSATVATLGIANLAPANGSATDGIVSGTLWQASGGNSQSSALNGTYSVTDAAHGRVTFTGLGNHPPVLYASGGAAGLDGFFAGTNSNGDAGRMVFQSASATNYSDSSFPGGFKAVYTQFDRDNQTNQYVARLGQITFDGSGGFTGTYDENGPNGLLTSQAINANYGVNTDGSGFFEQNTWPWVTRIDHCYYIDVSASDPNPVVNDVGKQ